MSRSANGPTYSVGTSQLRTELEQILSRHYQTPCSIRGMRRRLSDYCSSYALEEIDLRLDTGARLQLIFKNLSWASLIEEARHVKPDFLYNPLREIDTYRLTLPGSSLGTATCYGAVIDPARAHYWLFLERVPGLKLRHVGDFAVWQQAARWLATLHSHFAVATDSPGETQTSHLLHYDNTFYRLWIDRASTFLQHVESPLPASAISSVAWLAARYDQVIERLLALPTTVIHGEFFASNVLVRENPQGQLICPVDWEMAAVGPGLMDLAALTTGTWTQEQKTDLAFTYYDALGEAGAHSVLSREEFLTALDYCHLHLAVQWLGWSTNWSPPSEEEWDWLGEALRVAQQIGL